MSQWGKVKYKKKITNSIHSSIQHLRLVHRHFWTQCKKELTTPTQRRTDWKCRYTAM